MLHILTDEAVHKVDFTVALPDQLRWRTIVDGCRRSSRVLSLFHRRQIFGTKGRQSLLTSLAACRRLVLGKCADPADWLEYGQTRRIDAG